MKTIIENMYKAFDESHIPAVPAGMDDNIVWNEGEGNSYTDGNPYRGLEAVLNGVFARLGAEWENFRLADIKLHGMTDHQVLATLRYHVKFVKSGNSIDAQAAHL